MRRRDLLAGVVGAAGATVTGCASADRPSVPPVRETPIERASAPAFVPSDRARPVVPYGVQSGDVTVDRGIVWSKSDRLARMQVEWDTDPSFSNPTRVPGPVATADTDYCARVELVSLPPGRRVHYRVVFEPPDDPDARSEPARGSFVTAPGDRRDIVVAWSGDCAGQGWGIDKAWGGMKIFEAMRRLSPDVFLHCGDQIYADDPIVAEVALPDGTVWKNVTTEAKSKVAETLAEFRGNFAYNLLDENVRRFNAEVALYVEWDDHEVRNNWYPGQILDDARYTEKHVDVLAARARRAMGEYTPMRLPSDHVYRKLSRGPMLDVFMLDERTYRGKNGENRQKVKSAETAFLGDAQLAWLQRELAESRATWKLLVSDMPLGLIVGDGVRNGVLMHEAWANGAGPPLGRELELAELLSFIKRRRIENVVFVTADVHYAAAHRYHPARARFSDFTPFWEFVAGPLHASTFGPNKLDPTFGPEVVYASPPAEKHHRSPAAGGQYFGVARIDGKTEAMNVSLHDLTGQKLFGVELPARRTR